MTQTINESCRALIQQTFMASNNGTIHFGQVIGQLLSAGVEAYQVDYRAGRATYYLPSGATLDLDFARPEQGIADIFNADALRAAIRGAQQGSVMYPEFKLLSQQAGCIGYTVWITGRHVSYFGRGGEVHIERFPD
ncbi:MAG: DUF1398 family protein [Rheinheimera sp.]|nr:DUF1398 family protein [Rheinheimera sp.]